MVALVVELTVVVVMLKLAEDAPAGTVTLAGNEAAALLLARLTTVAAAAVALKETVPCAALPPVTVLGVKVKADTEIVVGGGGVTVSVTWREPSLLFETVMVTF
jgi:hypothetical protein